MFKRPSLPEIHFAPGTKQNPKINGHWFYDYYFFSAFLFKFTEWPNTHDAFLQYLGPFNRDSLVCNSHHVMVFVHLIWPTTTHKIQVYILSSQAKSIRSTMKISRMKTMLTIHNNKLFSKAPFPPETNELKVNHVHTKVRIWHIKHKTSNLCITCMHHMI